MAKYGISEAGVQALNQLAQDMSTINDDISDNGRTLKTKVQGLEEGLGVYADRILELVDSVNVTQEAGRESVDQLTASVRKMAQQVEAFLNAGLG